MELISIALGLQLLLFDIQKKLDIVKLQQKQEITLRDLPIELQHIAICESGGKQHYANGKIVKGPYGEIGLFQIHPLHKQKAKSMNLDIYDPNDNMEFALYLYKKNGLKDWEASKHCWKPKIASR